MGIGDWGLGIADWGLAQSPIPNPQSPIPNPHLTYILFKFSIFIIKNELILFFKSCLKLILILILMKK